MKYKYKNSRGFINTEKYPEKWNQLIKENDLETAKELYGKFYRNFSLEKYIYLYGEEEGTKKFNDKNKNVCHATTLEKMISKYGEEEGTKKYYNWKKSVATTKENFIKRHGEEKGTKKWNSYIELMKNTNLHDRNKTPKSRNTRIEFYLNKGYSLEESKELLKKRQNTSSLESFIRKYGEEEGKKRYQISNKKKSNTLENFIKRHGEDEGTLRYNRFIQNVKYSLSLKYYIDRYGVEEGRKKYTEINKKKVLNIENFIRKYGNEEGLNKFKEYKIKFYNLLKIPYSKISVIFFNELRERLKKENLIFEKIYCFDNEYCFYLNEQDYKCAYPDFYIKDINFAIEFYGDYWHRHPEKYNDVESNRIRENDKKRIKTIQDKFKTEFFIVWQSEYCKDKEDEIFNIIINKIKNRVKEI